MKASHSYTDIIMPYSLRTQSFSPRFPLKIDSRYSAGIIETPQEGRQPRTDRPQLRNHAQEATLVSALIRHLKDGHSQPLSGTTLQLFIISSTKPCGPYAQRLSHPLPPKRHLKAKHDGHLLGEAHEVVAPPRVWYPKAATVPAQTKAADVSSP